MRKSTFSTWRRHTLNVGHFVSQAAIIYTKSDSKTFLKMCSKVIEII